MQVKKFKFLVIFDFLHRFKKILAINCKNAQCYAISWLFYFKMSSNTLTQLCRPSGYGDYLLFVPYSRVLRYHALQPSSIRREGVHILQPTPVKSRVVLT